MTVRAVVVKCPECRAALECTEGAQEVRCSYCNTLVLIQRRSRFLQRPEPLPPRAPDAPPAKVATQSTNVGAFLGLLFMLALVVGLPTLLCKLSGGIKPDGVGVVATVGGRQALILTMVEPSADYERRLAAYDLETGDRIWISDALYQGIGHGFLCLAGDVVINSKATALRGVALADGALRWKLRAGEVVTRLCAGPTAKTVRVVKKDKQVALLEFASGTLRPVAPLPKGAKAAKAACPALICNRAFNWRRIHRLDFTTRHAWQPALPQMKLEYRLKLGAATVLLGKKRPGTAVSMLARVQPRPAAPPKVLWRKTVSAGDPLKTTGAPDPNEVALNSDAVAVAYEVDGAPHRLTVFSLANGRRRFDVALPRALRHIGAVRLTATQVLVIASVTAVYDAHSGKENFTVD